MAAAARPLPRWSILHGGERWEVSADYFDARQEGVTFIVASEAGDREVAFFSAPLAVIEAAGAQ